ncbi:unnamed protein product, partial [Polarella glacialis]
AACAMSADSDRADRWLFRMKALEVLPDNSVYHALMEVAAEAARPGQAELWLKRSWQEGFEPDLISFRWMLRAIRKAGDTAQIESWVERLMNAGLKPDISCVNEVIGLFSEQAKMDKVAEWLGVAEQSLKLTFEAETYNLAIAAYTNAGDIEAAEAMMEKMTNEGVSPTAKTFALMVGDGKSPRGNDVVERYAQRLIDENFELDGEIYTSVIGAWAAAGNAQAAEEWYSRMVEQQLDTPEALALLVDALVLSGGAEGEALAEEWITQAKESDMELTPAVYAARASADVFRGDFEQVEARMQQMEVDGLAIDEDCLTVLLLSYARATPQQPLLAEQMFKQQILRGKMLATKEVLEALRAAVGGSRCLALRRELQISAAQRADIMDRMSSDNLGSISDKYKKSGRRVWKKFRPPEMAEESLKWE